ncbi:hypothetical protein CYMTET_34687, partial [Cymbomonas tetramitiformis]
VHLSWTIGGGSSEAALGKGPRVAAPWLPGRRAPARLLRAPEEPRLAPAAAAPLQLYLMVQPAVRWTPGAVESSTGDVHLASFLAMESPEAADSGYEQLVEWLVSQAQWTSGSPTQEEVHAMSLRRIGAQGAATAEVYASLVDSLSQAFAFSVSFPPASWSGDTSLSFFPMIPDLHLVAGTAGASGQQIANINFSTFNLVDKNYTEMVAQYFDTTATSRVGTNAAEEVPVSLATLLFIDFFSCLAQTSLNHVYSFMRTNGYNPDDASRTHTLQDILKEISATDGAWMSVAGSVSASFRSGTRLPTHLPGDPQLQKQPLQAYLPHGKHGKPQ